MPKAAMHKNGGAVFLKHYVRAAWKMCDVQTKSEPSKKQFGTKCLFRFRVPPANPGHVPASMFAAYPI